jgi:hypothetical protein
MSKFGMNQYVKLEEFIRLVKDKEDRAFRYAIYVPENTDSLSVGMDVFVGEAVSFDEDDNEVYPANVKANNLEFGYSRDHFQDVVDLAFRQKPSASADEVVRALNHYAEHDDFLDLS